MRFVERRPFADPDVAARKLVEIANGVDTVHDGRIYIERVNTPFWRPAGAGRTSAPGSSAPLLSAGCGGTNPGLTCGSPMRARCCSLDHADKRRPSGASKLLSSTLNIALQASSASAKVLNGEPMTLTAPVLE